MTLLRCIIFSFSAFFHNCAHGSWTFSHIVSQGVRIGNNTSSTLILNTGTQQGCVLSPVLFTLFTHDCTPTYTSNSIIQFPDNQLCWWCWRTSAGDPHGGLSGAVTSLCRSKQAKNWLRTSGKLEYSLCSPIQCLDTFPHACCY